MPSESSGHLWLAFAFMSAVCWGLYGLFLHSGQMAMSDPQNGRYKAFLWVGVAYLLIAVLGPAILLWMNKSNWQMPGAGVKWSLIAGALGAIGALGVLLSFGAKGQPAVVMSIIFAAAPVVNAVVALILHPPAGGVSSLRWPFLLGILLAALGGTLVSLYKPAPGGGSPPPASPSESGSAS